MFDYNIFEKKLSMEFMKVIMELKELEDIYIVSLDCMSDMRSIGIIANTWIELENKVDEEEEDYYYYKYCEEEWAFFETFIDISKDMKDYVDTVGLHELSSHRDKIIEICLRVLSNVKKKYDSCLFTYNIRDYFGGNKRKEYFQMINGDALFQEYCLFIDEAY